MSVSKSGISGITDEPARSRGGGGRDVGNSAKMTDCNPLFQIHLSVIVFCQLRRCWSNSFGLLVNPYR